ncbi:centrosomal protein 20 isoform X1 [Cuculus canorus]|uniref:centrosomal protein 20 isoform X1 n=1 Tax=Cuculus canorus TaxID=55661 RepID=UPI0023AB3B06|nr:centrosomal protein 20 isoform X1 [Cuculus canorus]
MISLWRCRNCVYIVGDKRGLNTVGFILRDLFMVIVLRDTLEKRGALGQIKARIRAEVFNALDDQSEPRPPLSHENLLINELIREYLDYNKYKYAASVLTAESGQPEVPLDRQFLAKELNIVEDANGKSVRPLLYGIISHFLHGGKEDSYQNALPKMSLLNYPKQNLGKPPTERNQIDRIPEPGRMAGMSIEEPLVLQSLNR